MKLTDKLLVLSIMMVVTGLLLEKSPKTHVFGCLLGFAGVLLAIILMCVFVIKSENWTEKRSEEGACEAQNDAAKYFTSR